MKCTMRINQDACTAECIKRIQKDAEGELIKIEILPWYHIDAQNSLTICQDGR